MSETGPQCGPDHEPQPRSESAPQRTRDERTVRGLGQAATRATVQTPEAARRDRIARELGQTAVNRNRDRSRER